MQRRENYLKIQFVYIHLHPTLKLLINTFYVLNMPMIVNFWKRKGNQPLSRHVWYKTLNMNFKRTRKGMCCFSLLSASWLLKLLDGYDTFLKYGHQQGWTTVLLRYKSLSPWLRGAQDTRLSRVPHPLCFAWETRKEAPVLQPGYYK